MSKKTRFNPDKKKRPSKKARTTASPALSSETKAAATSEKVGTPPELSPAKKRIFTVLLVLIPVIFFLVLELGLSLFNYGGNLDLFVTAPEKEIEHYKMCNREVSKRYFFMQFTTPKPSKDLFLKEKPANGYRIFVLGGSTSAGFPYGNNLLFSRILNQRLADTFPEKRIECVNTAMSAINSYTMLDFTDKILEEQPDAILIYAGHNEFYGALGVASVESLGKIRPVVKLYLQLKRFRTFLLIRDFTGWLRRLFSKRPYSRSEVNPAATLMERIVADQTIPLDSDLYQMGVYQFRENLTDIIKKFKQAGVPVLVSELVSNIRDQRPFMSAGTDSLPAADEVYRQAQMFHRQGQFAAAKKAYDRAKDLDVLRFRATEEFNQIIHEVAAQTDAPVVPMKQYFEAASAHGLIGDNITVDHLHPNIRGYFLMADAFFNTMRTAGLIAEKWNDANIKPAESYLNNWGITRLDTICADLSIRFLKGGWPFQPKSVANRVIQDYIPTTPAESLAVYNFFNPDEGIEVLHLKLAEYYEKRGDLERALAEYKALYYTIPFETMFYERATNILLHQEKYDEALPILQKSLQIRPTVYALKWIGQIWLTQNKILEALPYLEKVYEIEKTDLQMLYNLCRAYILTNQPQKAQPVFSTLQKLYPESKYLSSLRSLILQRQITTASDSTDLIVKAKTYIQNKQLDAALPLLYQSLKTKETEFANKWIGKILMSKKQIQLAIQYLEKAYQMNPADPDVLFHLSQAYAVERQFEKAQAMCAELEQKHPRFPHLARLKEQLKKMAQK